MYFSSWCNNHQMAVRLIGKLSLEKVVHVSDGGNSLQTVQCSPTIILGESKWLTSHNQSIYFRTVSCYLGICNTFNSISAGLGRNWVYGACCSAQPAKKKVETSSWKSTTGVKRAYCPNLYTQCLSNSQSYVIKSAP